MKSWGKQDFAGTPFRELESRYCEESEFKGMDIN